MRRSRQRQRIGNRGGWFGNRGRGFGNQGMVDFYGGMGGFGGGVGGGSSMPWYVPALFVSIAAVAFWAILYFYFEIQSFEQLIDAIAKAPVVMIEKTVNLTKYFVESFIKKLTGSLSKSLGRLF